MLTLTQNRDDNLDALLRTCINTPSHSGQEAELLDKIQHAIEATGTHPTILRGPWGMAVVWPGKDGNKTGVRLADGHIDHVSAEADDWASDPFDTHVKEVEGDKLYFGRGSVDQIGGAVCAMQACVEVAQKVPEDQRIHPFGFVLAAAEELAEGWGPQGAVEAMIADGWTVKEAVITEPSRSDVMTAQMGRGRYRIQSKHPQLLAELALDLEESYHSTAKITGQRQALTLLNGNFHSASDATIDSQIPFHAVATFNVSDSEALNIESVVDDLQKHLHSFLEGKNVMKSLDISQNEGIIKIVFTGQTAHSAFKAQGKNAGLALSWALREISEKFPNLILLNAAIGDGTLEGKEGEIGELFYDHRTDIGETPEQEGGIIEHIQSSIKRISEKLGLSPDDSSVEVYTQIIQVAGKPVPIHQFFPAWQLEDGEPLFIDMQAAVQSIGKKSQRVWGFCTGGSGYAQKNVRLVGIGPGDEELAHMVDEHVPFSEVQYVTGVLVALMENHTRN